MLPKDLLLATLYGEKDEDGKVTYHPYNKNRVRQFILLKFSITDVRETLKIMLTSGYAPQVLAIAIALEQGDIMAQAKTAIIEEQKILERI